MRTFETATEARAAAKAASVIIPKGITTWRSDHASTPFFEVWAAGQIVWSGFASSASEAKANFISNMIAEKEAA